LLQVERLPETFLVGAQCGQTLGLYAAPFAPTILKKGFRVESRDESSHENPTMNSPLPIAVTAAHSEQQIGAWKWTILTSTCKGQWLGGPTWTTSGPSWTF
jgi:hypothetical protein